MRDIWTSGASFSLRLLCQIPKRFYLRIAVSSYRMAFTPSSEHSRMGQSCYNNPERSTQVYVGGIPFLRRLPCPKWESFDPLVLPTTQRFHVVKVQEKNVSATNWTPLSSYLFYQALLRGMIVSSFPSFDASGAPLYIWVNWPYASKSTLVARRSTACSFIDAYKSCRAMDHLQL
jgi:hypothetical protein